MPAAPLTAQQLDHFRARLEAMRTTLQREIEAMPSLTDDDAIRIGDQTDQASAESEREFEVVNLARALHPWELCRWHYWRVCRPPGSRCRSGQA